jgi:hypothetical protein
MRAVFAMAVMIVASLVVGCVAHRDTVSGVQDTKSAIRIGMEACSSKNIARPPLSDMRAELRGASWHVWLVGRDYEVFATDVDAKTGAAGPCSVCVS